MESYGGKERFFRSHKYQIQPKTSFQLKMKGHTKLKESLSK